MQPTNIGSSHQMRPPTSVSSTTLDTGRTQAAALSALLDMYNAQIANYQATISSLVQQRNSLLDATGQRHDVRLHQVIVAHENAVGELTVAQNNLSVIRAMTEKQREADIQFVCNL